MLRSLLLFLVAAFLVAPTLAHPADCHRPETANSHEQMAAMGSEAHGDHAPKAPSHSQTHECIGCVVPAYGAPPLATRVYIGTPIFAQDVPQAMVTAAFSPEPPPPRAFG